MPPKSDLESQVTELEKRLGRLDVVNENQQDEIASLRAEDRAYQREIERLNNKVEHLEAVASGTKHVLEIGKEVRLRFLEKHKQRMGKPLGAIGHERVKKGDRAAHRGRPVVDAWLCMSGYLKDAHKVYQDLYGVHPGKMKRWSEVQELVEVAGYRASLKCEGNLTEEFEEVFERILEVVEEYEGKTDEEMVEGMKNDLVFLRNCLFLQDYYDAIVATNNIKQGARRKEAD